MLSGFDSPCRVPEGPGQGLLRAQEPEWGSFATY